MAIPSLNIGGGKWATKQDKLLAYKQNIGGRYFAINGDTSRNSTATFTNQNGLIESVGNNVARVDFQDDVKGSLLLEPQSTNLITQSESFGNSYWTKSRASIEGDPSTAGVEEVVNGDFATDTDWTKGTGWAISGGVASCDGTNTASIDQVISSLELNKNYLISFDISNYISGTITTYLPFGVPNLGSFSGDNTYTVQVNVSTLATKNIYFKSNSFIGSIDNVSVKEVQGFASPSLDSPTGAFKLVEDTSTGSHVLSSSSAVVPNGSDVTYSVFAKANERDFMLIWDSASNRGYSFDLANGTTGVPIVSGAVPKIETYPNGWYKCSIISTVPSTTARMSIYTMKSISLYSYQGDGVSGIDIFGAQVEALPYSTSYIPTSGSSVTRVQDVANNFGDVNTFNSSELTIIIDFIHLQELYTSETYIYSLGSDSDNAIWLRKESGTDSLTFRIRTLGVNQVTLSGLNIVSGLSKMAFKCKNGDISIWYNGNEINTSLASMTLPLSNIFNFNLFGSQISNNKVKQVQVYKEALTDAQLITLTTI